ncbi:extracellular solute-binding protein [Actinobacteria bacterium YIM 96077]|uniref:ABC transporter substrate-binding protein n=1 Tax=Phytoactinopolyspora halophila TaxID=1981511 RepID=A0A329QEE5_9ACTN|nr:extracellular solute-binding protein [Phytoactinopolyspora halophila]AYY13597.1 extracellular solute-binding protein [Actinobacteria bacterium YIM 96077]RAW10737.1 ABC transporter substrate-binding protein [Phytoactinopolyspora halophila]
MTQRSSGIGNSITRRRALQLLGLGGIATVSAVSSACAGPGSGEGGEQQGGSGGDELATGGPVEGEISFAHWRAEDQDVLEELFAQFTEEYPDASVSQDISPSNDYQSSALQRIRSGNIGDLFVAFRGAQFVDMVNAGLYADLSGTDVVDLYQPDLIEAGAQDGTQYGLPYQLVFNQPVTNLDMLESVGITEPPPDWDSFLAMCEDLLAADVIPMAWPGGEIGNAGHLFNCMVMNNAPSDDMCVKIETGEYKCTDDWFLRTLEQYAELRPYFQSNATGTAVEPAQQLFAEGQAAIMVTGSFHIAAARELGADFPMGMLAPITVSADEMKYEGIHNATFILGVNTASDNQAAAMELLRFLSAPEPASTYANGTAQHLTVTDVEYENEDLATNEEWLQKQTLLAPRFQFTDLDIRNAAEQACIDVVGGDSPEQAAEAAQQIIDQRVDA